MSSATLQNNESKDTTEIFTRCRASSAGVDIHSIITSQFPEGTAARWDPEAQDGRAESIPGRLAFQLDERERSKRAAQATFSR